MSDAFHNPYDPTPIQESKLSGQMDYMRSFHFIFENPNWTANVLWCGLCMLSTAVVPVIGQLVMIGYLFEVIEAIHLRRTKTYPDFEFDFDRLIEYLVRGFWVFLVQLVLLAVVAAIVLGLIIVVGLVGGLVGAAGGDQAAGIAIAVILLIGIPVLLILAIVVNMFMVPIVLRAGLTQDFGQAFNFSFAKQFVRSTWLEMIITALFLMVAAIAAEIVGFFMLCIGIFFTMSIIMFMQAHLGLQLYELHLARGGEAIPLKPAKPAPPVA